jgi:hypothetical protein
MFDLKARGMGGKADEIGRPNHWAPTQSQHAISEPSHVIQQ